MKIHIAYDNIDAELELIPTHRPEKKFRVNSNAERVSHVRSLIYDASKRNNLILKEEDLFNKLIEDDIDINTELAGKKIGSTTRITVDNELKPVYNYTMYDVLVRPDGVKQERPHMVTLGNVHSSIPITITDELFDPKDILLSLIVITAGAESASLKYTPAKEANAPGATRT